MSRYYSRRKFLKATLSGAGMFALSTFAMKGQPSLSSASAPSVSDAGNENKQSLLNDAREAFYRREYDRSETLCRQYIQSYADDVAGYDLLAKNCNRSGNQTEPVALYRSALDANSSNPVFYDRLARAMNALSLGNFKQEKAYMSASGETFLLGASAALYLQAIRLAPDAKYLYDGLLDTARCIEKKNRLLKHFNRPLLAFSPETASEIASVTSSYMEKWKESRRSLHRGKTASDLTSALDKMNNKKRRELYFDDEKQCRKEAIAKKQKEFIYPYFVRSVREKQTEAMENYFAQINGIAPSDTQSKHLLTKRYRKNGDYQKLVAFRQNELSKENTFWGQIGLAQALLADAENNKNSAGAKDALTAFEKAEQKADFANESSKAIGAVYGGIARCRFALSSPNEGKEAVVKGLGQLPQASGIAHSLLIDYAEGCDEANDAEEAEAILLRLSEGDAKKEIKNKFIESYIRQRETDIDRRKKNNIGQLLKEERQENKRKNREKRGIPAQDTDSSPENLKSAYALAKIYERRKKNRQYNDVLTYIENEDRKNQFVRKRKQK